MYDCIIIWSYNSADCESDGNQISTSAENTTSEINTSTDHMSPTGLLEVSQTDLKPDGNGKTKPSGKAVCCHGHALWCIAKEIVLYS